MTTLSRADVSVDEPWIDVSGELWLAGFPGLGTVTVAADGSTVVKPDPVAASDDAGEFAQRERALQFGWAEPLSFARRGYSCVLGAAFAVPADDSCVLFTGAPPDSVGLVAEFGRRGWQLLAEGLVPVRWQGDQFVVHAREAPALAASRHCTAEGIAGAEVRSRSDACEVPASRATGSRPVVAVVPFHTRKVGEAPFEILRGRSRFQAAARLVTRGVLNATAGPESEPTMELGTHLRLAALPFARLRFSRSTMSDDLDLVLDWLPEAVASGAE